MIGRFTTGSGRTTAALVAMLLPSWTLPAFALPVVPLLSGPTGYAADPAWRGPALELVRASIRAELHPDLAVVEQTYTVRNTGEPIFVTIGLRYQAPAGTLDEVPRPLAVRAFVDGEVLPSENIQVQGVLPTDDNGAGWQLPIHCRLVTGEAIVSVILAIPTVSIAIDSEGMSRPSGAESSLMLDGSYSAWGWTLQDGIEPPEFTTALTLSPDVPLERLEATSWMANAVRHNDTTFWERAPNLTVRYRSRSEAPRIRTLDGLRRAAQGIVERSARGHIDIPASALSAEPPGRAMGAQPVDPARTRRAMLVPATALLLLLAGAYLLRRRWEKRF
jgi:hypothetical protein